MIQFKNKLLNIKMPHTYVILGIILLSVIALAYIIPSGEFDRVLDESSGKMIIIPDSFHYAEGINPHFFDASKRVCQCSRNNVFNDFCLWLCISVD